MITPKASDLALDSALFVSRIRIAEAAFITVMRQKGDKARRFSTMRTAQNSPYRRLQIVITKAAKDSAEMREGFPVRSEKRTLKWLERMRANRRE